MRITVEIDDDVLTALTKMTGEHKKSPAIAKAVNEYYRRMKAKEFGHLLREGFFDYPETHEEQEKNQEAN
jgi:Arc/MetJ family transcription regulator